MNKADNSHGKGPRPKAETRRIDPIVAAYMADVDWSLIEFNLKLTPTQRLQQLQELYDHAVELQRAGRAARTVD